MKKFFIIACLALVSCGCPQSEGATTFEVKFKDGSVVQYEGKHCSYSSSYITLRNGSDVLLMNSKEVLYVEKIN